MAVELSVALESVLLGRERGDNRFKVSLRSGIAFSHDLKERIKCRKVIKDMYDIRSDLVHGGDVSNSAPEKREVVKQAIRFTSTILINLIENGIPSNSSDWSKLELSGKPLGSKDVILNPPSPLRQALDRLFKKGEP